MYVLVAWDIRNDGNGVVLDAVRGVFIGRQPRHAWTQVLPTALIAHIDEGEHVDIFDAMHGLASRFPAQLHYWICEHPTGEPLDYKLLAAPAGPSPAVIDRITMRR